MHTTRTKREVLDRLATFINYCTHYPPFRTIHHCSSLGSFPTGMEEAFSGAKGDGIYDRSAIPSGRNEESYRAVFSEGKVNNN